MSASEAADLWLTELRVNELITDGPSNHAAAQELAGGLVLRNALQRDGTGTEFATMGRTKASASHIA